MNPQKELEKHFQRCKKCGRWEPRSYKPNEKKHECPDSKNFWVPKKFEDGKHVYG
jgi:hypothetical protein